MGMGVGMRMGLRMRMRSTKQSRLFRRRFIVAKHCIWFVGKASEDDDSWEPLEHLTFLRVGGGF